MPICFIMWKQVNFNCGIYFQRTAGLGNLHLSLFKISENYLLLRYTEQTLLECMWFLIANTSWIHIKFYINVFITIWEMTRYIHGLPGDCSIRVLQSFAALAQCQGGKKIASL